MHRSGFNLRHAELERERIGHGQMREFARSLPNHREVTVKELHHLQEDSPKEIGKAPRDFLPGLRARV